MITIQNFVFILWKFLQMSNCWGMFWNFRGGHLPPPGCAPIVGMHITSINETAGFTYCRIPGVCNLYYWRAKAKRN